MVAEGLEFPRVAVDRIARAGGFAAEGRVLGIPGQVMTDIEIEVPVAVEVGPRGRGGPIPVATQPGRLRGVLEGAVAPVVEQGIGPPSGDEHVGSAIVVVVGDGHPVTVSAGQCREPRPFRDILEGAVAQVAEQAIAVGDLGLTTAHRGRERPPLEAVDVQPPVAVIVEEADATAHGLRELSSRGPTVVVGEVEPHRLGVVGKVGWNRARGGPGLLGGRAGDRGFRR